jgi:RNA polymerase sigma factor (sigma-70 family)
MRSLDPHPFTTWLATQVKDMCGANCLTIMYLSGNEPVMKRKAWVNGCRVTGRALLGAGVSSKTLSHGRRQMRRPGFSSRGMVRFGPASSQQNRALPGFEELAMPLFDSLYNLARWLAQNQNDAEDLVQETYLKALRSYASFEPGTNFRAWIFQILRNTFLGSCSTLERRMTLAMDSEEDLPATSATPESLLIGSSDIDAVRSAIEQLPVIFREVILLCDVEDASYREIAEILSVPIGTVMSRLARARKMVRESVRTTGAPRSGDLSNPRLTSGNEILPTLGRADFT